MRRRIPLSNFKPRACHDSKLRFLFLFSAFNLDFTLLHLTFIHPTSINMRSGLACLLGLAGVALTNATLSAEKRDSPAVLAVPMVRDTSHQLSKRSKTVDVGLKNEVVNVRPALRMELK